MQKRWLTILFAGLAFLAACSALRTDTDMQQEGVVQAVLFWSETCPHCHEVMERSIPPLEKQYGDRLEIKKVEISDPANYQVWVSAIEAFQVPPERQGVPILIIGEKVLVGSLEIPEQLPGLIEQYLEAGGVDLPAIPGL